MSESSAAARGGDSRTSERRDYPIIELWPFTLPSSFWIPAYADDEASCQHAPFLFWLTEALRPRVVVQLGSGTGTAFFACNQAVQTLALDCRCFWYCGDSGEGHTQENMAATADDILAINEANYAAVSSIMAEDPLKGVKSFKEGAVDIVLINDIGDEEQFEQVLAAGVSRLSSRGVLIIHGVNRAADHRYMAQSISTQCETHASFEFPHGDGLGVVGIGATQQPLLERLFQYHAKEQDRVAVRRMFSQLGQSCVSRFRLDEAKKKVAWLHKKNDELRKSIADREELIQQIHTEIKKTRSQFTK